MNEHIANLANQSGFDVDPTGKFGNYSEMHRLKRFAELIVRECVSALQTKIDDGDGYGSYEAGVHRGFIGARNIIKKHFGVEL